MKTEKIELRKDEWVRYVIDLINNDHIIDLTAHLHQGGVRHLDNEEVDMLILSSTPESLEEVLKAVYDRSTKVVIGMYE